MTASIPLLTQHYLDMAENFRRAAARNREILAKRALVDQTKPEKPKPEKPQRKPGSGSEDDLPPWTGPFPPWAFG